MRPRTIGKIVTAVLTLALVMLSVIFTFSATEFAANDLSDLKHVVRAIVFAILSLTFATVYRYFED